MRENYFFIFRRLQNNALWFRNNENFSYEKELNEK